ncbi:MAG TPA: DMT family transporter [Terriglobales bacterium]|nr:DMT family transporter [Terriglobales bacterium]
MATILCWGSADFIGGIAAKTTDSFLVAALAHASGFVVMASVALLAHAAFPSTGPMLWALAAGASGGVALAIFYRALASGHMGLNAPVAALLAAAIPVAFAFSVEGIPHPLQVAGFVLAGLGIWFISKPDHVTGRPKGLGLAVIAGLGFAGFFLCINQTGDSSALWSAALSRCLAFFLVSLILAVKWRRGGVATRSAWLGLLAGVLDVSGTAFFVRADQTGRLDASVVLCSLYPVITVLLAVCFLKERFTRVKLAGIAAAVAAVPLIALK